MSNHQELVIGTLDILTNYKRFHGSCVLDPHLRISIIELVDLDIVGLRCFDQRVIAEAHLNTVFSSCLGYNLFGEWHHNSRRQLLFFFLLSSGDRLQKLEDLFGKYNQAKGKSRRKFSKRIASELENLEKIDEPKKSSQLVQRLEKPVMGGVTFRGGPVGLVMEQNLTHRSEGEKRTVAVFRIQHK